MSDQVTDQVVNSLDLLMCCIWAVFKFDNSEIVTWHKVQKNDDMKEWSFKVDSSPVEMGIKLKSALGSLNGFVFDMDNDKNKAMTFKMRKRIMYAWYLAYHNWTIVNGKLLKTGTANETDVEISFTQHFLIKLIIFTHLFLGLAFLIAIISGISNSASTYIIGGVLLAVGIILWVALQKKFENDIQTYRTLISEVLKS